MAATFIPSIYHHRIFDFIAHNAGHGVIAAVAGSSKTSTLLEILARLPARSRVLFAAFSTDIVKEIALRVSERKNIRAHVACRNLHGVGFRALRDHFHSQYDANKLQRVFADEQFAAWAKRVGGWERPLTSEAQRALTRVISLEPV